VLVEAGKRTRFARATLRTRDQRTVSTAATATTTYILKSQPVTAWNSHSTQISDKSNLQVEN